MPKRNASENGSVNNVSTLKIDKDCFVDSDWIKNYIEIVVVPVCRSFEVAIASIKMCNSKRKGVHFYISLKSQVEPVLANKLQWLLGDDCRRVDFNRARIESSLSEWNKLCEVPGRRLKTIYNFGEMKL